jgi:hypothetical protein
MYTNVAYMRIPYTLYYRYFIIYTKIHQSMCDYFGLLVVVIIHFDRNNHNNIKKYFCLMRTPCETRRIPFKLVHIGTRIWFFFFFI